MPGRLNGTRMKFEISPAEARRIAIHAQGLGNPVKPGSAAWPRLKKSIDTMELLQIDSVNVLCRSHYLPVFARAGHYAHATLDARTHGGKKRACFEYWAHEASFLPMALYPLLRWKMNSARKGVGTHGSLRRFANEEPEFIRKTLAEVKSRGALAVSDLPDPGARSGNWWGWSKGKYALEYLFDIGELTAAKREGFERYYDLPENVIDPAAFNAPVPAARDAIRELLDRSGRALGLATEFDLRDYFRLPVAETKTGIAELVEEGRLRPVAIMHMKSGIHLRQYPGRSKFCPVNSCSPATINGSWN